jgi:hypothetical protein
MSGPPPPGVSMCEEGDRDDSVEVRRGIEAAILVEMIEAHPIALTESALRNELTTVENTPGRMVAINSAVEGLVEVGLVTRESELLRLTPPALRAGALEIGIL